MKTNINYRFRKILNDLKRRPEDAANDLEVDVKTINNVLQGKEDLNFEIIKKAIKNWPINMGDFFGIEDDTNNGYKIFKSSDSKKTQRVMFRGGKKYYSYRDTVMSKLSPFRPEWIQQLTVVDNNDPENQSVKFNNGHFLHQFTYFVGPVNFYYIEDGVKKVAVMNTGDSMYISPYVPHTFTTRKNEENLLGHILALTYSDKVNSDSLNELVAVGFDLTNKLRMDISNELEAFKSSLVKHFKNSSLSEEKFKQLCGLNYDKLIKANFLPDFEILKKISSTLSIGVNELLPNVKDYQVKIQKYEDSESWFYPSKKNKIFKFVQLTNLSQLPMSKGLELTVLNEEDNLIDFEVSSHQYFYNIGKETGEIFINNKYKEKFEPGDSIYLKPGVKHRFSKKSKILIFRIGGRISGESLNEISMLSDRNFKRLMDDNIPWFNE